MEISVPEHTKHGVIRGRDALFLDKILSLSESELVLTGEINTYGGSDENYEIEFSGILHMAMTELDFFEGYEGGSSFCVIENSEKIKNFEKDDSAGKLTKCHRHFVFQTYDTVFEVVAKSYKLSFSPRSPA